jgi:hypothetical protein
MRSLRIVDAGWGTELMQGLAKDSSVLRIICPFIKTSAVDRLLSAGPTAIQVLTRFNLNDFAEGVSDIAALAKILRAGGRIRGVKGLHSKLYLFGKSRAVITSANLTVAGLDRNPEFGAVLEGASELAVCQAYFDDLWSRAGKDATSDEFRKWASIVGTRTRDAQWVKGSLALGDYGSNVDRPADPHSPSEYPPLKIPSAEVAFVKFLGEADNRVQPTFETVAEIERSGCQRTLSYPRGHRPRNVVDGSLMFIGRMTKESGANDIRIFGFATGFLHEEGVDDASGIDIERRPWRAKWPHYVRVSDAHFLTGTMANGVSLNALMSNLGADSFSSTQRNRALNLRSEIKTLNENPRSAYSQQPSVKLSEEGQTWLTQRLFAAFKKFGEVPQGNLDDIA